MPRPILDEPHLHPAIRERVAHFNGDIVQEVQRAVAAHPVVVVGMAQNPFPRKAVKALRDAGVQPHVLSYGSYLSQWRRRTALKMWTGWPTLPMELVKGVQECGASDVQKQIDSGELKRLLA